MPKIEVLTIALFGLVLPMTAQVGTITPCDLAGAKPPHTMLSIGGTVEFDMHGMYLYASDCHPKTPAIVVGFPNTDSAPKVDFVVSEDDLQKLRPYLRLNGGSAVACGVLTGRLFEKEGFHLRQSGGGPHGNGYGPRGAFRWMLVLQSVQSIHNCEKE